ncbi:RidA family protein [Sphingomicrobium clamense]|uniref:RidA family protein n=1 Tax=Sphingomicrobium clamense TaxID=2851013 RepID=A0ABS6V7M9_9SPHN|nr:RidA family protein [Sphingomicrobium sp. B8]MBW0145570.1 RidA family protein [Sphingomicrobium sp. B8]
MTTERAHGTSPFEKRYGFCRALRTGNRILVAGTGPVEEDGSTAPGDAAAQARRCFSIALQAIAELGGSASDVVRTRMFITDADDADAIGTVHGEVFADAPPTATMVVVAGLVRPEWRVEIEAEAEVDA